MLGLSAHHCRYDLYRRSRECQLNALEARPAQMSRGARQLFLIMMSIYGNSE